MKDYKKSVKVTLGITYSLMVALIVFVVALPFIATWYVEMKSRPNDLAVVTMLSSYPCVPFSWVALSSMAKLLKNILAGNIVDEKNYKYLRRIIFCLSCDSLIMIIAGFFYKPFFISGASALFCGLIIKVFMDVFRMYISKEKEDK